MSNFLKSALLCAGLLVAFCSTSFAQFNYTVNNNLPGCFVEATVGWSCTPCAHDYAITGVINPSTSQLIAPTTCFPADFAGFAISILDGNGRTVAREDVVLSPCITPSFPLGSVNTIDCFGNSITIDWFTTPFGYEININ